MPLQLESRCASQVFGLRTKHQRGCRAYAGTERTEAYASRAAGHSTKSGRKHRGLRSLGLGAVFVVVFVDLCGEPGARPRLFTSDPDRDLRDLRSWAVARCRCAGGTSLRAALFRQVKPLRCCRRTSLASASSDALALQSQLRRHMRLAEHQPGTKIGPALPWGALSAPLVGAACRTRAGGWTEPPHLPLGLFSHWTVTPREEAHLRFVYRPARCWVLALSRCSMTVSWTNGALFSPSSTSVGTRGPSSP